MPLRIVLSVIGVAWLGLGVRAAWGQPQTAPETTGAVVAAEEPATEYEPARDLEEALRLALEAVREVEAESFGSREKLLRADFYQQEAVRFDPSNRKAEYIAGRMNRLIGRSRDAFSQVSDYVRSAEGSVDWEAWKILGDLHLSGKYYVQAEGKYRRAAELSPDEASIYVGWARNCMKRGKRDEAVEKARLAVKLDPTKIDGQTVLAEALEKVNRLDESAKASQDAIGQLIGELQGHPGDLQLLLLVQSQHVALQETLRGLMRKNPETASAYTDYIQSIMDSTEIDRSIKMHEMRAAAVNGIEATQPNTPPQLIEELVKIALALNQPTEAIEVLEAYLEQDPGDATALAGLDKLRAASAKNATAVASTPSTPLP